MPAASISSQVSDAVYFASIVGLAILLARPVYAVYSASEERGAQAVAAGLVSVIESLSPGMTVAVVLAPQPLPPLVVKLDGRMVTVSLGAAAASIEVGRDLPRVSLVPGATYEFTLSGGELIVEPARGG